jgi:hypothetical protein
MTKISYIKDTTSLAEISLQFNTNEVSGKVIYKKVAIHNINFYSENNKRQYHVLIDMRPTQSELLLMHYMEKHNSFAHDVYFNGNRLICHFGVWREC